MQNHGAGPCGRREAGEEGGWQGQTLWGSACSCNPSESAVRKTHPHTRQFPQGWGWDIKSPKGSGSQKRNQRRCYLSLDPGDKALGAGGGELEFNCSSGMGKGSEVPTSMSPTPGPWLVIPGLPPLAFSDAAAGLESRSLRALHKQDVL